jgi:hemolysin III
MFYTHNEEIANTITHGLGIALSSAGFAVLVVFAALYSTPIAIVSCSIYGISLVLMYSSSTLYHMVRSPRAKRVWRVIDHSAIYLLIAGTYTPFCLIMLKGGWGWTLFGIIWGLALLGIVTKAIYMGRYPIISVLIYIAMGWLVIIAAKPVFAAFHGWGLGLLIAGGIVYTGGILFYALDKMPFNHAVWHLFVLGGSILQYCSLLFFVILAQ